MRAPAICIGNSSPFEEHCWVIHLSLPRIVARAEPTPDRGVHLRLVTAGNYSEEDCRDVFAEMVAAWESAAGVGPTARRSWSYWPPLLLPPFLVLDGRMPDGSDFAGLLDMSTGVLWSVDHCPDGVVRINPIGEHHFGNALQDDQNKALAFYDSYLRAELSAAAKANG